MRIPILLIPAARRQPARWVVPWAVLTVIIAPLVLRAAYAASLIDPPTAERVAAPALLPPELHLASRYDPISGETSVAGTFARDLCIMLALPHRWETAAESAAGLRETRSGAEIALSIRSVDAPASGSKVDLATRDAGLLQSEHEGLIGRPAQAVVLAHLSTGIARWTATWIDANLPGPAHALTLEAFLIELPQSRVLELSFSNVGTREAYEEFVREALSRLRIGRARRCGREVW